MTAANSKLLDWDKAQAQAYALLTSPRGEVRGSAHSVLRFAHDTYWSEPLQRAAMRAVDRWRSGKEEPPSTTEALAASLARHARYIDDNRRYRERTRTRLLTQNAERIAVDFCGADTVHVLDGLCAKDLFNLLLERLFEVQDPDIPRLLDAWLSEGIDYDDNQGFAKRLELDSAQAAHNIKRRLKYHAHKIMNELRNGDQGDQS